MTNRIGTDGIDYSKYQWQQVGDEWRGYCGTVADDLDHWDVAVVHDELGFRIAVRCADSLDEAKAQAETWHRTYHDDA